MLNIVTIEGKRYVLDVGNGSTGSVRPLPLVPDEISVNVGVQEIRLLHTSIPDFTHSNNKLWVYEHRNSPEKPWTPTYCFDPEIEFLPVDYEMMNYFTSSHRSCWFTYLVVCVKFILEDGEIVGDVTLFGADVKKRIKGKSEVLAVCQSEEERVKALDEFLGVKLSLAEIQGIKGLQTELLG
jgi:arylamine N-acetyltransferase